MRAMHSTDVADLVSSREALELLGLTDPSTISRWVAAGKLTPAHKLPGKTGAYLFNRADVEALAGVVSAAIQIVQGLPVTLLEVGTAVTLPAAPAQTTTDTEPS